MLSEESLLVAEEEVVECSPNKLCDIYAFVAKGCFPQNMHPVRRRNLKKYAQKFIIDEDKLYYVGAKKEEKREVVMEAERKRQIFLDCHFDDIGHHLGQKKTINRIQSKYYWLGIIKDVVDWIKVCETCQHTERNENLAMTVRPMLSEESLQVAKEEVVECSPNKLCDIYTFVARGCFPQTMHPVRRRNLKRFAQKFVVDGGKLYYVGSKKEEKREVVIEAERKRQIFLDCHFNDIGHHLGQKKTINRIQSKYYWLGIIKDVVDWIKLCDTCQHKERNKNLARTVRPIKVDAPWDIVGIDFIGPFPETQQGSTSVTVLIDYFSKWPEAFPVQSTDALSVSRCISKCIYRFGAPKAVVCAQNVDFCNEVTKLLCDKWSITQKVSPLDHLQLNPLHDCTIALLKEAVVQMATEKQAEWDDFLDPVLFLFRTSTNPTTKFTPYSLMFNRKANLPNETSLLNYDDQEQDVCSTKETASACMTVMQEQQNSMKQLVIANMNAAYKQEKKKSAKRRTHHTSSMTFKISDPLFGTGDSPPPKKLKESLYLSFPVETVLTAEQSRPEDVKTELAYHLDESDVH